MMLLDYFSHPTHTAESCRVARNRFLEIAREGGRSDREYERAFNAAQVYDFLYERKRAQTFLTDPQTLALDVDAFAGGDRGSDNIA